jgi:hypothetical protein
VGRRRIQGEGVEGEYGGDIIYNIMFVNGKMRPVETIS